MDLPAISVTSCPAHYWSPPHSLLRAHIAKQVTTQETKKAAADKELMIKKAEYKAEVNKAEAQATVAFEIEKAIQGQEVGVAHGVPSANLFLPQSASHTYAR